MSEPRESCVSPLMSHTIDPAAVLVALARDGFRGSISAAAIPGLVALAATEGIAQMLEHVREDTGLTWLPNGRRAWMFESFHRP